MAPIWAVSGLFRSAVTRRQPKSVWLQQVIVKPRPRVHFCALSGAHNLAVPGF